MKVFSIQQEFGLAHLRPERRPRPRPGPGEILVRMEAVSLNYRDLLVVRGLYNRRWPLPLVPCSDGAGVVAARGRDARRFRTGDRVCPIFARAWIAGRLTPARRATTLGGPLDGTLAEYFCLPEESAVAAPRHLAAAQAACLPCAGVTAYNALVSQGRLRPGDRVLVQGGGGVSLFALQIARAAGARVIAVTSTRARQRKLEKLGADQTLNYRETPEWGRVVRKLAGGSGVDHVVEVGGAGTLAQSLAAVRIGGRISIIGNVTGAVAEINLIPVLMGNVCLQGVLVGSREVFENFVRALEASDLRPVIDRRVPFASAPAAFERLAGRKPFGKVVIEFPGPAA